MTRDEFLRVVAEKNILGYICPSCKNVVQFDKTSICSLEKFFHDLNQVGQCKHCDPFKKNLSYSFLAYKYLDRFIFAFSFPNHMNREAEEYLVDFNRTKIYRSKKHNANLLEINFNLISNSSDKKLTLLID